MNYRDKFTVFPLHPIERDADGKAKCLCREADCDRPGKHPAWPYSRLDPGEKIPRYAGGGLALVTGWKSDVFVVDTDGAAADARFRANCTEADLDTFTVATPSGGRHYYFKWPGFAVRTSVGELLLEPGEKTTSKIDIRGDNNGLAILPESPHASGREYVLEKDVDIREAPAWLLDWPGLKGKIDNGDGTSMVRVFPVDVDTEIGRKRLEMGREACAKMPAAIKGQNGSGALWDVALCLVRKLELPLDKCHELITEVYSPRCAPPWSPNEIAHKLEDARDKSLIMPGNVTPIDTSKWTAQRDSVLDDLSQRAARGEQDASSTELAKCSDTGNGEIYARLHRDRVRFIPSWQSWLVWDGSRWRPDDLNEVAGLTKDVIAQRWAEVRAMGNPDESESQVKRMKWALASASRKSRDNMLVCAQTEPGMALKHTELDADPFLLNAKNGTIDLRVGTLREASRSDLITRQIPIEYDVAAMCPTWDRFLSRVTGENASLVAFLARAVGYSLTSDVREQVLFFLQGGGQNGKSTFTTIVRELLGDYGKQGAPDLLLAKRNESHPAEIADLFGARFVLCQEVEQGRSWAESTLKQLTGGDGIKARRMREDFWEFRPTHKLWVCANHKPKVRGVDHGIWRRIKLIPFNVQIPDSERDPELPTKLREELPGILAWAVRGALDWQSNGLGVPQDIVTATAAYREEEDSVGSFLAEQCETGPGFEATKAELFGAFDRWARAANEPILTKREFGTRMIDRGFTDGKTGPKGHFWRGLRVAGSATGFRATG